MRVREAKPSKTIDGHQLLLVCSMPTRNLRRPCPPSGGLDLRSEIQMRTKTRTPMGAFCVLVPSYCDL